MRNLFLVFAITYLCVESAQAQPAATPIADPAASAANKRFDQAIAEFAENLEDDARPVFNDYLSAEPFPQQDKLLVGTWYGAAEDPDNKSYWRYQRLADGTMINRAIDLDLVSMEYSRRKEESRWKTKGRVLYEFCEARADGAAPLAVLLLNSVAKEKIEYRIATFDEPVENWFTDTDRAGKGPPIKLPEDFEEILD